MPALTQPAQHGEQDRLLREGVGQPILSHVNDPAAGSPTATLLRLLLPLAAGHHPILVGPRSKEAVLTS